MSLADVPGAMAAALEPIRQSFPDMQIYQYMNQSPAASPSIDIYGDTPFRSGAGFGNDMDTNWLVRIRQTTVDYESGQQVLLKLLDRGNPESVQDALESDQTLGGAAQSVSVVDDGVSGLTEWIDDPQTGSKLVGNTFRVRVIV